MFGVHLLTHEELQIPRKSKHFKVPFSIRAITTKIRTRHRMLAQINKYLLCKTAARPSINPARNSSRIRTRSLMEANTALQVTISSTWMTLQMDLSKGQNMQSKQQVRLFQMEKTNQDSKITSVKVNPIGSSD